MFGSTRVFRWHISLGFVLQSDSIDFKGEDFCSPGFREVSDCKVSTFMTCACYTVVIF